MRTQYEGWGAVLFMWVIMSGIFAVMLFANVVLGVITGAFLGWLFSLTFIGRWIIQGFRVFKLDLSTGNLSNIGAAAGFLSSFFKYSIKMPEWNTGRRAK
ncbi:MAG: hypothetical protein M0Z61_07815 [Nitrospiraceae bacterium]|nr:hypothetical protein [Nitrospiraceae bacterium]